MVLVDIYASTANQRPWSSTYRIESKDRIYVILIIVWFSTFQAQYKSEESMERNQCDLNHFLVYLPFQAQYKSEESLERNQWNLNHCLVTVYNFCDLPIIVADFLYSRHWTQPTFVTTECKNDTTKFLFLGPGTIVDYGNFFCANTRDRFFIINFF